MSRAVELPLAAVLALLLAPLMVLVAVVVLLADGRPIIFASPRVAADGRTFLLYKFRTMRPGNRRGVTGGDKVDQITRLGRRLRRVRLDELPQIINVLGGDIGFVGPRPPSPEYVAHRPDLYAKVLKARPGITGLATLAIHRWEGRVLSACSLAEDTDRTYVRRCMPRKGRIDLIYARRRSLWLDLWLMWLTAAHVVAPARRGRLPRPRPVRQPPLPPPPHVALRARTATGWGWTGQACGMLSACGS